MAIRIEHSSGAIDVLLVTESESSEVTIRRASVVLTARKILDGSVFVPASLGRKP